MRHKALADAVGQEVEFFKDRLTDQDLIAQNHGFLKRIAVLTFEDDGFSDCGRFSASVGITGDAMAAHLKTQALGNVDWNHGHHSPGIDHGSHLESTNLVGRQRSPAGQSLINRIG